MSVSRITSVRRALCAIGLALTLPLALIPPASARELDRSVPPAPGPPPKVQAAPYARFELPNGLRVFVVESRELPLVSVTLTLDRRPPLERDKVGTGALTGELLRRGTTTRTRSELDRAIDQIGATISTGATSIGGTALRRHAETLVDLIADMALRPSFAVDELRRLKRRTEGTLRSNTGVADEIARNVVRSAFYGPGHPLGESATPPSVRAISLDDIRGYHRTYFRPNVAYLTVVGDVSADEARALAETHFSGWERAPVPSETYPFPEPPEATRVHVAQRPGAVQTLLQIGHTIPLVPSSEDYLPALVMRQILGGSGGRLFLRLREREGLTYGSYARLSQSRELAAIVASANVRTDVTRQAVDSAIEVLRSVRDERVGEDELARAKAFLSGAYALSLERPETSAEQAVDTALYGLPDDFYSTYLDRIARVTADEVQAAANKYLLPDRLHIVAVGDAAAIETALSDLGEINEYDAYGRPTD